jgi:hypothetical protein
MKPPTFGAEKSKLDIRTFSHPVTAYPKQKGGTRYDAGDIENQSQVGICTAISLTQNAGKALKRKFSADFQYLIQKKYYDNNWDEGSSIFNALRAAKGIGLLPAEEWTHTTQSDRDQGYDFYITKLKAIPETEIARLILIANQHKIKAYASVPVTRDSMAQAIDNSKSGILVRFSVGKEWYTDIYGNVTWAKAAIEPLRKPKTIISGHAITESNYDGGSFRVANTWSTGWADQGTAYHLLSSYAPTEAWSVFYEDIPEHIQQQIDARDSWLGHVLDFLQKLLNLVQ